MRRSRSIYTPFSLWLDVAMRAQQMMLASVQVVGHRTQRMARAGVAPSANDRREFARMWQEKVDAGTHSLAAMTAHATQANCALGATAMADVLRSASAAMAVGGSRTLGELYSRQATLIAALARSAGSSSAVATSVARMSKRGMQPFHAASTRNARRLARR